MKINNNTPNYSVQNSSSGENISDKKDIGINSSDSTANNQTQGANQTTNIASGVQFQLVNLSRIQQAVLLRELLDLPKDMKDLLALLTFNEVSSETISKLLAQNSEISLKDIQLLLATNSKDVISKLLKLLQPSLGNSGNAEQLSKLISLINKAVPSPEALPLEVFTKTVQLYLPWLPLAQQQDINFQFEERSDEENQSENIALIMYISTVNLGRFKVIITLNSDNTLNIEIESEDRDENKSYIEQILNNINKEMTTNRIPGKTNIYPIKSLPEKVSDKREVSVCPVSNISSRVMLAAYSVAKTIFEIDEKISLVDNRRQMLE